jgi:hypothetical protein
LYVCAITQMIALRAMVLVVGATYPFGLEWR